MHDADANANLVQQCQFFRERDKIFLILRDLSREFDDKRLSLEALNVRQRLAQEIETELIVDSWVSHLIFVLCAWFGSLALGLD